MGAQLRLTEIRPTTLGQAARIQGVTPAEISLLAVMLRKKLVIQKWAKSFFPHFEQTPL
jgi:tRNA uridine 5-carboxymethylaminomethyl modification enzyme